MDKSILSLIILGIALAVVHVPNVLITIGIISLLVMATIKLLWGVLQSYNSVSSQL